MRTASVRFVPYNAATSEPNIIVDGSATENTALTLSHWPHSGTPPELKADTSAEIVFNYLDSPRFHVGAQAASNNHFDEDGLIGLFALIQPELAQRHRELLIDASRAGDFGVYSDRNAARLAFTLSAFQDPGRLLLPASTFAGDHAKVTASLYAQLLERIPHMVSSLGDYQSCWAAAEAVLATCEKLIDTGSISIEEKGDLDLALVRVPPDVMTCLGLDECHPYALHSRTGCSRMLVVQGNRVELQYRYEGWVQMASRRPAPRVDLKPLADELNQREQGPARWLFDGVEQITPALHIEKGETTIPTAIVIECIEHHLRTGQPAWNPYQ